MKKRWDKNKGERIDVPEVDAFLTEIEEVCKKHDMHISHEDGHGSFIIVRYEVGSWIENASVDL